MEAMEEQGQAQGDLSVVPPQESLRNGIVLGKLTNPGSDVIENVGYAGFDMAVESSTLTLGPTLTFLGLSVDALSFLKHST